VSLKGSGSGIEGTTEQPSISSGRSRLPWARPRRELALLVLIAVVALLPLPGGNPQDVSRACLGEALLHGHLSNDSCLQASRDYAVRGGHLYSDKAPGLSVLELPVLALLHPLPFGGSGRSLWAMRALTVGLALLGCAFLVGRVSEGLAPGYGAISMVTFGLGTIAASLAQISFEHLPAALAMFGAFLLAWRRKPLAAGLLAGAGLLIEYESALLLIVIGLYVAATSLRSLARFAVGALPGAMLLGAYDWAAFGAPWHLSYRYVAPEFSADQGSGFFGIGVPTPSGLFAVLAGNGGLLFVSPVLALAGYGLARLGRRFPAEAVVAGAITILMLFLNAGYYLPYGGTSPGPRFFVPALPFLALGLAEAFRRYPRSTLALAVLSVFTTTAISLGWASGTIIMRNTVWGELLRLPHQLGSSAFVKAITPTLVAPLGAGKAPGVALMVCGAAAALLIAARAMPKKSPAAEPARSGRPRLFAVLLAVLVLAAVDDAAIFGFPYGNGYQPRHVAAAVKVYGSPASSYRGGEVNYRVEVTNLSPTLLLSDVVLTIKLAPGMQLVGPPKVEIGNGCSPQSGAVFRCDLNYMAGGWVTNVWFGIQFTWSGLNPLFARVSSDGFQGPPATEYDVGVGK
jgi:hypothetical protein